jgi:HAD superfamily hydrolase (TIGR01509 family)
MHFRYVIWDFDGTLFDTYPALNRAIRQAAADLDIALNQATLDDMLAGTLSRTVQDLVTQHSLDLEAFVVRIQHYRHLTPLDEQPPFPGAIDVLERVQAAGGRNYMITHRDRASLTAFLDWQNITGLFGDIIDADHDFARKPDPAAFVALLERHELPRAAVLAVGDRSLDVLAAHAAGLQACWFGAGPPPDDVQADYVAHDFDDVAAVLGLLPG